MKKVLATAIKHMADEIGVPCDVVEVSVSKKARDSKATVGVLFPEAPIKLANHLAVKSVINKHILVVDAEGGGQVPITPREILVAMATLDTTTSASGVLYS